MQWHVLMFQRDKTKYTSCHLSLFKMNNRNEVGGFVGCQGYVCVHWVFRRTIIWVFRVTSFKSSHPRVLILHDQPQHLPNCKIYYYSSSLLFFFEDASCYTYHSFEQGCEYWDTFTPHTKGTKERICVP